MLYTEILKNNKHFLYLYKKCRPIISRNLVIYAKSNGLHFNRMGITAGKKVGNAVKRNRAKRIIRAAYRENEINMPIGIDIVIVARTAAAYSGSKEISGYLRSKGIKEIAAVCGDKRK